ncbi:MAG: hypothetical protein U0802_08735 [Candidatus Binatia bacterium]
MTLTTGLGEEAPAGALQLDCQQAFVQLDPGQAVLDGDLPARVAVVYTTGNAEAFYLNGVPKVGSGAIRGYGEPFVVQRAWQAANGPGRWRRRSWSRTTGAPATWRTST